MNLVRQRQEKKTTQRVYSNVADIFGRRSDPHQKFIKMILSRKVTYRETIVWFFAGKGDIFSVFFLKF